MKIIIQLESLSLLILGCIVYNHLFPSTWWFFIIIFFVPDISFAGYVVSNRIGSFLYNLLHHQGFISIMILIGWTIKNETIEQIAIIFMMHSFFDRALGYGLKFTDSFHHTHLGWIGKQSNIHQGK